MLCPICLTSVETMQHLCISCMSTMVIWKRIGFMVGSPMSHIFLYQGIRCWADSVRLNTMQKSASVQSSLLLFGCCRSFATIRFFLTVKPKKSKIFDNIVSQFSFWICVMRKQCKITRLVD